MEFSLRKAINDPVKARQYAKKEILALWPFLISYMGKEIHSY